MSVSVVVVGSVADGSTTLPVAGFATTSASFVGSDGSSDGFVSCCCFDLLATDVVANPRAGLVVGFVFFFLFPGIVGYLV